jgi:Phage virion morphogenesis family
MASFLGPNGLNPYQHFAILLQDLEPRQEDLMLAGQYLRGAIRDRCFADQDISGGGFIPYTEAYARKKGQQNVDLYGRGRGRHMLDALTVQTDPSATSIGVGIYGDEATATRAKVHNEGGVVRTRQGTGGRKHIGKSNAFGADIRRQKKGGKKSYEMPQREFLGATEDEQAKMQEIIMDSIKARLDIL